MSQCVSVCLCMYGCDNLSLGVLNECVTAYYCVFMYGLRLWVKVCCMNVSVCVYVWV